MKDDAILALTQQRLALSQLRVLASKVPASVEELFEARHWLQRAFMWLGKAKLGVGAPTPYPDSMNPANNKIEPPQDVAAHGYMTEEFLELQKDNKIVELVKYLRRELDAVSKQIRSGLQILPDNRYYQDSLTQAWVSAEDAKHAMGMYLGRIKSKEEADKEEAAGEQGAINGGAKVTLGIDDPTTTVLDCLKLMHDEGAKPKAVASDKLVDILEYLRIDRPKPAQDQLDFLIRKLNEVFAPTPAPVMLAAPLPAESTTVGMPAEPATASATVQRVVLYNDPTGHWFLGRAINYLSGNPETFESIAANN